jgi:hypothetical protein
VTLTTISTTTLVDNMACSDQISTQQLENMSVDAVTAAELANSRAGGELGGALIDVATTRLGDTFSTLRGQLSKLGYEVPIAYTTGIVFTVDDGAKTVDEGGIIYAPRIDALPLTTTGTWATDSDNFYVVQDFNKRSYYVVDNYTDGVSDSYAILNDAIQNNTCVEIPVGRTYGGVISPFICSQTINVPEGHTVFSRSLDCEIKAAASFTGTEIFNLEDHRCAIFGIKLTGNDAAIDAASVSDLSSKFNDYDTAVAMSDVGTLSGVRVAGERAHVYNNYFTQFDRAGVVLAFNASGSQQPLTRSITNNFFAYNMIGILEEERAEYAVFSGNIFKYNYYGIITIGGNNTHTGNKIDHNRVNIMMLSGINDSHGEYVGGSANHGKLGGVLIDKIANGEIFSGVSMFDGGSLGLTVKESRGVHIHGGAMSNYGIKCVGSFVDALNPTYVGRNSITNTSMGGFGVTYLVDIDGSNMDMSGNYNFDGENLFPYDQNINNGKYDSDLWMIDESGGIPIFKGKDLSTLYVGAAASTGAVAINFPEPMSQFVFSMDVEVVQLDKKPFTLTLSGYINSSGVWTHANVTNNPSQNKFDISFGFLADNTPVIYLGDVGTVFRWQTISVKDFTVYLGAFSSLHYFKFGWSMGRETTALMNVAKTVTAGGNAFSGDVDTILEDFDQLCASGAANLPISQAGHLKCRINGNFGYQEYITVLGALYVRGYNSAWGTWSLK